MKDYIKLSFTGDVMCEDIQIASHITKDNKYNFDDIFSDIQEFFSNSDYVIANLETPIGGKKLGYSNRKYSFNTPESFLESIKKCGIDLVTTANNHCLDRGIEGLKETIKNLDRYHIKHIGTYSNKKREPFIEEINGIKVGFLSYTYGTNAFANQNYLKRNERYMINLFQAQELANRFTRYCYYNPTKFHARIYNKIYRTLYPQQAKLQVYERESSSFMYMRNLKREIKHLKKNGADYIIACMHMGGQYNREPNELTLKVTNKVLKYGADAVIGHHEHVIHKCDVSDKTRIKTYSLGNFTGLAGVLKEPYDRLAEYSIVFNLYLGKEDNGVSAKKCTFSITKSIANGEGKVKTVLLYDLINNCTDEVEYKQLLEDNLKVYNLFLNKNYNEISLELEYNIY